MRTSSFLAASAIALAATIGLTGCSGSSALAPKASAPAAVKTEAPAPKPVNLDGTWKQTNSHSDTDYQQAKISHGVIEIDWIVDNGDTTSIFWVGTVMVPEDGSQSFTWDSKRDKSKTDNALLASTEDVKPFSYKDGEISYKVSMLGTTTTVRLGRQ